MWGADQRLQRGPELDGALLILKAAVWLRVLVLQDVFQELRLVDLAITILHSIFESTDHQTQCFATVDRSSSQRDKPLNNIVAWASPSCTTVVFRKHRAADAVLRHAEPYTRGISRVPASLSATACLCNDAKTVPL